MSALFVAGTDTGVGKTVVSAWLALHWQAHYWKPIQSGLLEASDSACANRWAGVPCHPETHVLRTPASPHRAARLEGRRIALEDFSVPVAPRLVVEGAGGLMVPLNERDLMIDLVARLGLPVLLVARATLGTINHTLLSLQALRARAIPTLGVVLNGPKPAPEDGHADDPLPDTLAAIETLGGVPVLDVLPPWASLDRQRLSERAPAAALRQALQGLEAAP